MLYMLCTVEHDGETKSKVIDKVSCPQIKGTIDEALEKMADGDMMVMTIRKEKK